VLETDVASHTVARKEQGASSFQGLAVAVCSGQLDSAALAEADYQ